MTARAQLNHLFDRWGVWVFMLMAAAYTITIAILPELEGPLQWVIWPILVLYPVAIIALGRRHEPIMCGTCWKLFPLNPAEHAAGRARPFLASLHVVIWLSDRLRRLPFVDALNASLIVMLTLMVAVHTVTQILLDPPWVFLVTLLFVAFIVHSGRRHAQLQPWCPWCRRGGPPKEQPEAPDPQPSTGRDLALEGAK